MRKFLPSAIIIVFLLSAIPAIGCGDKLVGLSHGAHYMNMAHPGVILVLLQQVPAPLIWPRMSNSNCDKKRSARCACCSRREAVSRGTYLWKIRHRADRRQ